LAIALCLQTYIVCAAAGAAHNIDFPNVFVYDKNVTKAKENGGLLFLFSNATLGAQYDGFIVSFFSRIDVTGNYRGDIYAFFSDITVENSAAFDGTAHMLSSDVSIAREQAVDIGVRGIGFFDLFMRKQQTERFIVLSNTLPLIAFQVILGVFNVFVCAVFFFIKKSFMHQASVLLKEEPLEVIRTGIAVYFVIIGFILIFALTVFLIPLILIGFLAALVIVLVGETALSLYIGYLITDTLTFGKTRRSSVYAAFHPSSFLLMVIGVTGIEVLKLIPLIGLAVRYLFLPLITIGMVAAAFTNGFLRKRYSETPYLYDNYKKDFDIQAIRDIIIK
jgi:hypothetical protein